jgi:hypothetical protein
MCRNGSYRERGIKELDGYGVQLVTLEPEFAVKVDPSLGTLGVLTEPASVVAKAWAHGERDAYDRIRPLLLDLAFDPQRDRVRDGGGDRRGR